MKEFILYFLIFNVICLASLLMYIALDSQKRLKKQKAEQ